MKFKKEKYIDPWVLKKFRWPSKENRFDQYAYHVGLLDKYSKHVPSAPKIMKRTWGTSNKGGISTYFSDTTKAAV